MSKSKTAGNTDKEHVDAGKSGADMKQMADAKPEVAKTSSRSGSHAVAASKLETRSAKGVKAVQASDEVDDDFEKTAVSKVSEVATKTSKSTSSVTPDVPLLSEAQILKMSEKDYMNPAQLAFFKARLQDLEKELLKNAGETTEHLRETVLVPDPADRATIEEEHALELRTRDRERKLLKKVQQSILAIDAGDYGWCEETGEPIGIPRLLARPTATLSLEAQQRRELKQKLYGD
jgi:DnaK suppressor protein